MKKYILLLALVNYGLDTQAQRDTTKNQNIEIVSAYKPVLRNASKINFSGTQLAFDTNRVVSPYNIPVQQLFYAYQPAQLNALAIDTEADKNIGMRYYVKAGFGNYSTPYIKAAAVLGDESTALLNLYADHRSSKGSLEHQDFSMTSLKGVGSYTMEDFEITGRASIEMNRYHLFGYDHDLWAPAKDDVKQYYNKFSVGAGLQNLKPGPWGIDYKPTFDIGYFSLADQVTETNIRLQVPVEKKLREDLIGKLGVDFDFTRHSPQDNAPGEAFSNTVVRIAPALKYFGSGAYIHAGVTPTFYKGGSAIIPDVYFEIKLEDRFVLQGGWVGKVQKNTLTHLSQINPYIRGPFYNVNTKETEFYGGIRATLGSHFNIGGKVSWVNYKDAMLFLTDTTSITNHFITGVETKLNNLRIQGNMSYVVQDKFTINANLTLNAYNNQEVYSKAWNLVPLEVNGSIRYQFSPKLLLKGDVMIFGGPKTFTKDIAKYSMDGGTDLSAGAIYKINNQFSAWLDVNNIMNDKYSRWNNYRVYGLNLLGGVIVHF